MSYKSKKVITNMVASIFVMIAYIVYALGKSSSGPNSLNTWAISMLIFIGITIVTLIVVHIIFTIVLTIGTAIKEQKSNESDVRKIMLSSMVEDEMDKLISLKSVFIGFICVGFGFIVTLIALAFGASAVFAFHTLLGSFALGAIIASCVNIYFYERGIRNQNG